MSDKHLSEKSQSLLETTFNPYSFNQGEFPESTRKSELDPYSFNQGSSDRNAKVPSESKNQNNSNVHLPDLQIHSGKENPGNTPNQPSDNGRKQQSEQKPADNQSRNGGEMAPHLTRDNNGLIKEIVYPGGKKSTSLERDDSGNLKAVTIKDENGVTHFEKQNNSWYCDVDGMKLPLPGQIKVSAQGDVSTDHGNGVWETVKPDGSVINEKTNSVGCRIAFDKQNRVECVNRKDGSSVQVYYNGANTEKISESGPDGKNPINWTRQGDAWVSDSQPPQKLTNMVVSENGNLSFAGADGLTHVRRGNGKEILEGSGRAKFNFDSQGRVTAIEYVDGKKNSFTYKGDSDKLQSITLNDGKKKNDRTYTRNGEGDSWQITNAKGKKIGTWTGEAVVEDDGTFSNRRTGKSTGRDPVELKKNNSEENNQWNPWQQWQGGFQQVDESGKYGQESWKGKYHPFDPYSDRNDNDLENNNNGPRFDNPNCVPEKDSTYHPFDPYSDNNDDPNSNIKVDPLDITDDPENNNDDPQNNNDDPENNNDDPQNNNDDPDNNNDDPDNNNDNPEYEHAEKDWTSLSPDGQLLREHVNKDGSRASFDKKNNLIAYENANGVRFAHVNANGQNTINCFDPKTGASVNWTKGADGTWKSDSAQFKDLRKDMTFDAGGVLSYTNENGGKIQEHPDGTKQIAEKDGTKLDFDKDGQITKAQKGNLERTFIRDANGIAAVKDLNLSTKQERTIFERRPSGEENRTNIHISKNGDLSYQNPDGTAVIERSNMLHLELDKDGDITKSVGPKSTRSFEYVGSGKQKTIAKIIDSRQTSRGESTETWTRVANPDGTLSNEFRNTNNQGKARPSRFDVVPCADGEYEYKLAADKPGERPHVARVGDSGNDNGFSDNVADARENLIDAMSSHLDDAHKARFAAMLTSFEERAKGRIEAESAGGKDTEKAQEEWDKKVSHTYDHLTHMLTEDAPKAVYDLKTRSKLVEDAIYSMAWPAKADDQGEWGCCWQISGVYLGVVQDPNKMAKMLDQLSTSGSFTDTKGKTWTPPKELLRFTGDGNNWTIKNNGDGSRSPCAEIWTSVAAYLSEDGQRTDRGADGGDPMGAGMHAMKLITGDTWRDGDQDSMTSARYKKDLLLKGGMILEMPGHAYLGTLQKTNGQWQIISSLQNGDSGREVNGIVKNLKNWRVERVEKPYRADIPAIARISHDSPIKSHSEMRARQYYSNYFWS